MPEKKLKGICGVSKMVRTDVFHELNGFDPAYFMYYEDLDFSLRLHRNGYEMQVVGESILRHHHGGSSDTQSLFFARQVAWSRLYFQWRHASAFRKVKTLAGVFRRARREMASDAYPSEHINKRAFLKLKDHFPNNFLINFLSCWGMR